MTKLPHAIDCAPWTLYPDRGCISWPACLDCPFDPCINTADKDPTRMEHERAQVRREIILLHHQDMLTREIATSIGIEVTLVVHGLARYRQDAERARLKAIEERRKVLALQGLPTLEVTT